MGLPHDISLLNPEKCCKSSTFRDLLFVVATKWLGRDGEFDQLVSSTIRRCKREYRSDNNSHIWVLPYLTAEFRDNEESFLDYYDEIEICEAAAESHHKNAHQTRNRAMVDRSDLIVFCIQHESGGAWQTMKYARKQHIPYINLNNPLEDIK